MPFEPNPALPADVRSEPTLREFAEWVGRQPVDMPYSYCIQSACAYAQFARATGRVSLLTSSELDGLFGPSAGDDLCDSRTFGELASRLAFRLEALSESPAS